jgi:hypothetical protein
MRTKETIWRTCVHEAGHAVLLTALCSGCEYIDVIETEEQNGWTQGVPHNVAEDKARLHWIASMYAGLAAEGVLLRLGFGWYLRDFEMVAKALENIPEEERREQFRFQGLFTACRYVAQYGKEIKEVAHELFNSPTQRVEGDRVREIVECSR